MVDLPSLCIRNANIVENSGIACSTVIKLSLGSIGTKAINLKAVTLVDNCDNCQALASILLYKYEFHDLELDLDFVMCTPHIRGSITLWPTVKGSLKKTHQMV